MAIMKKIEAVIRASDLENAKSGLRPVVDAPMIATETVCCGPSVEEVRVYRGSAYVCDAIPCVWLHAVVDEEHLGRALDVLRSAVQRGPGREIGILVSDVERFGALTRSSGGRDGHRERAESLHEGAQERPKGFALADCIGSPLHSGA
jgi:nitrogen regulatory protein PII